MGKKILNARLELLFQFSSTCLMIDLGLQALATLCFCQGLEQCYAHRFKHTC